MSVLGMEWPADAVIRAGAGGRVQRPGESSRESLKSS